MLGSAQGKRLDLGHGGGVPAAVSGGSPVAQLPRKGSNMRNYEANKAARHGQASETCPCTPPKRH